MENITENKLNVSENVATSTQENTKNENIQKEAEKVDVKED